MFNTRPNHYFHNVSDIPIDILKDYELICFDLDNTLDYPIEETREIIKKIENKLTEIENIDKKIFIISNNTIEGRCESFCNIRGYEFLAGANKPFTFKLNKNDVLNSFDKNKIIFIGDKLVTDILGAKWYGVDSILVDQLTTNNNKWYTIFMCNSEKLFCRLNNFKKGEYY